MGMSGTFPEQENTALARRWFEEVWNKGRSDAIDEMFAPDGLSHGLEAEPIRGPAGFKPFHNRFRGAFPDIKVDIQDAFASGDKVALRWSVRMTHTGDHLGIKATGNPAGVTGMSVLRIRNGKIVEAWNNWDVLGLYQQLGLVKL